MMNEFFEPTLAYEAQTQCQIHPSAMVAKGAQLGNGVKIGPNAIIGSQVILGDEVEVGPGAILTGKTTIGARTKVFAMATLGTDPQDLKYQGEKTELIIGTDNMIREYVNISVGTSGGGGVTTIGDHNLIMAYSHIAHDCHMGNHCILANGVQIAGHVAIGNHAVFGGMSGGHQFCRFGEYAMIGAGAIVVQDVPPYLTVQGDRARVTGLNLVGLRRAKITGDNLKSIKQMYRIVFKENLPLDAAVLKIQQEITDSDHKLRFIEFLEKSSRGLCR